MDSEYDPLDATVLNGRAWLQDTDKAKGFVSVSNAKNIWVCSELRVGYVLMYILGKEYET